MLCLGLNIFQVQSLSSPILLGLITGYPSLIIPNKASATEYEGQCSLQVGNDKFESNKCRIQSSDDGGFRMSVPGNSTLLLSLQIMVSISDKVDGRTQSGESENISMTRLDDDCWATSPHDSVSAIVCAKSVKRTEIATNTMPSGGFVKGDPGLNAPPAAPVAIPEPRLWICTGVSVYHPWIFTHQASPNSQLAAKIKAGGICYEIKYLKEQGWKEVWLSDEPAEDGDIDLGKRQKMQQLYMYRPDTISYGKDGILQIGIMTAFLFGGSPPLINYEPHSVPHYFSKLLVDCHNKDVMKFEDSSSMWAGGKYYDTVKAGVIPPTSPLIERFHKACELDPSKLVSASNAKIAYDEIVTEDMKVTTVLSQQGIAEINRKEAAKKAEEEADQKEQASIDNYRAKLRAAVTVMSISPEIASRVSLPDSCYKGISDIEGEQENMDNGIVRPTLLREYKQFALHDCEMVVKAICTAGVPPPDSVNGRRIAGACREYEGVP